MAFRSLRAQLLGWLLVPLALYAASSAWFTYRNAAETATVVHDRLLLGSARMIAEQIRYDDDTLQAVIPPAALELFQSNDQDRVYYRVAAANGALLAGYAELPVPPGPVKVDEALYFDATVRGDPVRTVAFAQPVFGLPRDDPVLIEVAQTLQSRAALTHEIWATAMRNQLPILALAVLMVLLGLRHGLLPLMQLRERVQRRRPGALEPLDAAPVPNELTPLVHAINDYVKRLDDHMSAHSRFIANASHQLQTPLTLLNTQVSYGLRSTDVASKDDALRAIHEGVRHGIRVVKQLLTLSTAESGLAHSKRPSEVHLVGVVKRVLEESAATAQAKRIDLGFEHYGGEAVVQATPPMLHELVANLIDNALRYTPAGGVVTAAVETRDDVNILRIADDGPGIPPEERERVFERFYRLRQDKSDGCGLGLAIVREIANASGAVVRLSAPASGTGLVVEVTFPARPTRVRADTPAAAIVHATTG
ncbi:MAG TPA: sensor histidine kinase [Casimicrobiaceae bacterium]|jgi:two-component system sensor histidine kinase TctE|nr:sensor histidine kinase [Casimicrobiaceae bacterium]